MLLAKRFSIRYGKNTWQISVLFLRRGIQITDISSLKELADKKVIVRFVSQLLYSKPLMTQ